MTKLFLATLLLLSTAHAQRAVTPDAITPLTVASEVDDVSERVAEILARQDVPALGAAVVLDGRLHAHGVAGVRESGDETPVEIDDLWHLGSCTKAMTATLIAVLVERGHLSWDTTLAEAFPDAAESMLPAWREVTLDMLVHNRAGAPADFSPAIWGILNKQRNDQSISTRETRRKCLIEMSAHEPQAQPGSKFIYSNAGFMIAGHAAETKANQSWEDLMQTLLFQPLGITSGGLGAPGSASKIDQPRGHDNKGGPHPPGPYADNPPALGPAGTVHMTLDDWAKFAAAHVMGESSEMGPLRLSPEAFEKLHATMGAPGESYAAGWGLTTRPWAKGDAEGDTGRVLTHAGSNTLWYCVAWLAPERSFAVIVTCNKGGDQAAKACDEVAAEMIRVFLD